MMNITLRQLRYCEALARHRHFGRAAEASSVSQPALSTQIRELERALGAELFERSARQVRLSPFGEVFVERARAILAAVDGLEDVARAARGAFMSRLRIGIIPTVAPYILPAVMAGLTRAHADLEVEVRETLTTRLLAELAEGRLDAAIVALPVSEPSLAEEALFAENFVLVRPLKDEGKPPPSREMLREMRLLLLEEGHCFRRQALSFCDIRPGRPREVMDGSSLTTLVQMVAAGIGVTLIPEMAVAVETPSAAVSLVRFPDPQPSRTIGLVWRRTNPLAGQFREIAGIIRRSVGAPGP